LPGKTAAPHEIPYALESDTPPSIEAATKPQAEQVHKRLNEIAPKQITGVSKKQLLIANASGVVTAVTASGDVTNDELGVFTIGKEKVTLEKLAKTLGLTEEYLAAALKERIGITANRARATIIPGEETYSGGAAFGLMATPDEAPGIVLPEKGLIIASYQALWDGGAAGNPAKAAFFLGANQLKNPVGGSAPAVQQAETSATVKQWLTTVGSGLATTSSGVASTGAVTTGVTMALASGSGALCVIEAEAGTYNLSVKFTGTSTRAKERRLYVWTAQFS
jgi:hypothetical protein